MKGLCRLFGWCALFGVLMNACVYDSDDRCGPNQISISHDRCACADGYVPGAKGCVACGENEKATNGECVCVEGYARASAAATCEPIPDELGADCDTADAPCPEGRYPLCRETDGSAGYCTNECATSDDCDGGYKCQQDGDQRYCRRPPLGYGKSCDSDVDCEEGEATYCEVIQSHLCLVPCSAGNTAGCFVGEVCCNFVVFEPICVPSSACESSGGSVVE